MKEFSEKDKSAIIILDSLKNLSYNQKREILSKVKSPQELFNKGVINGYPKIENGITVITYLDELYPKTFLELKDFPLCLYCYGNISLLQKSGVAIVGSRKTISVALEFCRNLSQNLLKQKVVITGASAGVEREVLNATDGGENLICFSAGGVNEEIKSCPSFWSKFCQKGLLVSQYLPNEKIIGYRYIDRNRLIAKLCEELIVISGNENSGVRYTAEYAKSYHKKIYALPYNVGEPSGKLCNELIKSGAYLLNKIEDITQTNKTELDFTPSELAVLELIKNGINSVDKIVENSGMAVGEIFTALVSLEIKDSIIKCGADEYALTEF